MRYKIDGEFLIAADESGREKMKSQLAQKHGMINHSIIARSILSRPIEEIGRAHV